MDSHDERRTKKTDRRLQDSGLFPLRDDEGVWIVTERRKVTRRHSDHYGPWAGLPTIILIAFFLMLIISWVMIRFGFLSSPVWLPSWLIYPELLVYHLF